MADDDLVNVVAVVGDKKYVIGKCSLVEDVEWGNSEYSAVEIDVKDGSALGNLLYYQLPWLLSMTQSEEKPDIPVVDPKTREVVGRAEAVVEDGKLYIKANVENDSRLAEGLRVDTSAFSIAAKAKIRCGNEGCAHLEPHQHGSSCVSGCFCHSRIR